MEKRARNYDLGNLLKPYANKWVALSKDRRKVIASAMSLKEVVSKSQSQDVVLMRAFPSNARYARYAPSGV